jgi:hypothetical protein
VLKASTQLSSTQLISPGDGAAPAACNSEDDFWHFPARHLVYVRGTTYAFAKVRFLFGKSPVGFSIGDLFFVGAIPMLF